MQLQKIISKVAFVVSLAIVFIITGCDKENETAPVIENTIAGLLLKDADFSSFEAVMAKANLAITLNGTDPFTVFAPNNAAFNASGITPAIISGLSQAQAQTIFLYHTLNSKVMAADLPAGPNTKVTTVSGDSVFFTKNAGSIYVNGVKVLQSDIIADNGVIHKIDRVLTPPAANIVETIIVNGLDSLAKAITRATNDTTGDTGLDSLLNTTMVTMFAPTDSAFVDLLTALSLTDINDISVDTLLNVLKYHLVPGRIFSTDLADGQLTMLAGDSTTINLTNGTGGGPTITGTNNGGNASNITTLNIISRNGVVHIIDRVLMP